MEDLELLSAPTDQLDILLHCLLNSDIEKFQAILEQNSYLNLDHFFGDIYLGTLLDIICRKKFPYYNNIFIELLIAHGADPNIVNKIRKSAPLHFAVQASNFDAVKCLLESKSININILDQTGSSAVHYAVSQFNILELLLKSDKIDLNIANLSGNTPLQCALKSEIINLNCIKSLLVHPNLNVYDDPHFSSIKGELDKLIPDWNSYVINKFKSSDISFSKAFSILQNHKFDEFISIINKKKRDSSFLDDNNGLHTFLQYCCEYGLSDVVSKLIEAGANPTKTSNTLAKTPLMIAAYKGYVNIVKTLLKTDKCSFKPVDKETVLHCVVRGSFEVKSNDESVDHLLCLNMLLADPRNDIINQGDVKGNTALHYAAKQGENEMILCLLKAGASLSCFNSLYEPAFAFINQKILKEFLDSCINDNQKLPVDEDYTISLNYKCLKPVNNSCDINNCNIESVTPIVSHNTFESKPLLYMAENKELNHLLKHPLFTSFIFLKWCRIKKMFFLNLLFYLSFILLLALYIIRDFQENQNGTKNSNYLNQFLRSFLFIFLVILIFRELMQFFISPSKYLSSIENYLEIIIIILVAILLCFEGRSDVEFKVWCSVLCIMLSWGELVLLLGRYHRCATYMEMLKTVSLNFLKFLGWYSFLIIAFALSFYVLFGIGRPNDNKNSTMACEKDNSTDSELFTNPYLSVFKTIIMLTGEFDASSVPFVYFPGFSHVFFIAFLFSISIVLFNLLNGMAISDTQSIQSNSELVSYVSQVKLLAFIETLVLNPLSNETSYFGFLSCWEKSFINTYLKNKLLPKRINLFQEGYISGDCKIQISPLNGNQVIYSPSSQGYEKNLNCCKNSEFIKMAPNIVKAVKEVLLEKHIKEKLSDDERKKKETDQEWIKIIKYCQATINELKTIVYENKVTLDKLAKREGLSYVSSN